MTKKAKTQTAWSWIRCIQAQELPTESKSSSSSPGEQIEKSVRHDDSTNKSSSETNETNSPVPKSENTSEEEFPRTRPTKFQRDNETLAKAKQAHEIEQVVKKHLLTKEEMKNKQSTSSVRTRPSTLPIAASNVESISPEPDAQVSADLSSGSKRKLLHQRSDSYRRAQIKSKTPNEDQSLALNDELKHQRSIGTTTDGPLTVQTDETSKELITSPIDKKPEQQSDQRQRQNVSKTQSKSVFQQSPTSGSPIHSAPPVSPATKTPSPSGMRIVRVSTNTSAVRKPCNEIMLEWYHHEPRKIHKKRRFSYTYGRIYQPSLLERALMV